MLKTTRSDGEIEGISMIWNVGPPIDQTCGEGVARTDAVYRVTDVISPAGYKFRPIIQAGRPTVL
jgi:hypothetical protein